MRPFAVLKSTGGSVRTALTMYGALQSRIELVKTKSQGARSAQTGLCVMSRMLSETCSSHYC